MGQGLRGEWGDKWALADATKPVWLIMDIWSPGSLKGLPNHGLQSLRPQGVPRIAVYGTGGKAERWLAQRVTALVYTASMKELQ